MTPGTYRRRGVGENMKPRPMIEPISSLGPFWLGAGETVRVQAQPQQIFRVDRLFLNCDGLVIVEARVGNLRQKIEEGTPASLFNENGALQDLRDAVTKVSTLNELKTLQASLELREPLSKGLTIRFDTAEVGNFITLKLHNPTDHRIWVEGAYYGVTAP